MVVYDCEDLMVFEFGKLRVRSSSACIVSASCWLKIYLCFFIVLAADCELLLLPILNYCNNSCVPVIFVIWSL